MSREPHQLAEYRVVDGIAVLSLDHPPVNALSHCVRIALVEGVDRALADPDAAALVLICRGRTFFAGADVKELGKPIEPPLLADVMGRFEASTKPIVSAMHGTALGGGFELSLAGHFRVGVPSLVVGLPEVALGLLPGAGGTQRVPRLVGAEKGLELIGLGRDVGAQEALELGLIDAVVPEGELEKGAIAFARQVVEEGRPLKRVRDIALECSEEQVDAIVERFRSAHPELFFGLKAPAGAVEAVRAAATLPFDEGLAREREIAPALTASPESAAQRHLFFAERTARKLDDVTLKPRLPASLCVAGDWRSRDRFVALEVDSGEELLVLAEDVGFEDYVRLMTQPSAATAIVVTRHLDRISELRGRAGQARPVVGLNETHGIWEIVIDAQDAGKSATAVMGLARDAGISAIYVRPSKGLVVERLRRVLLGSIEALQGEGTIPADIAASAAQYGFAELLAGTGDAGGAPNPAIAQRLVGDCAAEAARLIEEGVVLRGSDIDYAMVKAGLWPLWKGGPAFTLEREGAERIASWCRPLSEPAQ